MFTLKVPRKGYDGYLCIYFGSQSGHLLPLAKMIDVTARSMLMPQPLFITRQSYKIKYNADASDLACSITADAIAGSDTIPGPDSSSQRGIYEGPATGTLTGSGDITVKRTCGWTLHNAFDTINLTYQSTASIAVTWNQ